ncbi:MAG: hypothetical protein JNM47_10530 [Hyphomonadaceae bacterium]|nr:hypothetical protein [Hyphomonadaceae bacterium]
MNRLLLVGALLALTLSTPAAHGQSSAKDLADITIRDVSRGKDVFTFDFGVPGSPALTLLGVSPDKVAQSNSLRAFVLSVPQVFDASDGSAISLDLTPAYWLQRPASRTYGNYVDGGRLVQTLYRTRLGVAVSEGASGAADGSGKVSSGLSTGLSVSLLNSSDPLLARAPGAARSARPAWETCLNRIGPAVQTSLELHTSNHASEIAALNARLNALLNESAALERETGSGVTEARRIEIDGRIGAIREEKTRIAARLAEITEEDRTGLSKTFAKSEAAGLIEKCVKEADLAARAGVDFDLGAGALWRGRPGRTSDYESAGAVAWASYRHPIAVRRDDETDRNRLTSWWMIGGSVRAGFDERVSTGDKTKAEIDADTIDGWLGVERYAASNRFSIQYGRQEVDPSSAADGIFEKSRDRYFVSFSQRLGGSDSSVWLNVAYGSSSATDIAEDDERFLVTLAFSPPDPRKVFGAP